MFTYGIGIDDCASTRTVEDDLVVLSAGVVEGRRMIRHSTWKIVMGGRVVGASDEMSEAVESVSCNF
jgi:hypothetical protein